MPIPGITASGYRIRSLGGAAPYVADAVTFDGNDYLYASGGMGASDASTMTLSFWWRGASDVVQMPACFLVGTSYRMYAQRGATNDDLLIVARNATPSILLNVTTPANAMPIGSWIHFMMSVDMTNSAKRHMYINGSSVSPTWTTYNSGSIDFSCNDWYVATWYSISQKINGDMAEFYLTNEYIDLSVQTNREKFITAAGSGAQPVDLGADGSTPTGTAPLVYLQGTASNWNAGTNYGSGNSFTMTGSVTDSSNEPVQVP